MKLTPRERMMLGVLLGLIVLWLEYTYILKGQLETLAATRADLANHELRLDQLNNAAATNKSLDAEITKSMGKIGVVMDKYFTTTQQEEIILLMNDLLANTGVNVSAFAFSEPDEVTVNEIPFKKMTVTMDYNATYDALFGFLKKIWDFQKTIVVDQLNMDGSNGDILEGSISIDLYYLLGHEGTEYKDNLYQMVIDESFFKVNPFSVSPGSADFRINYVFTGGKEPGAERYTPFADISGHWAEKEINAFGEKGYLTKGQDNNFAPDTPITRGEFIIITDRIYKWPVPETPVDLTKFTDYANLGSYENAIAKAVFKGYLGGFVVGFTDNTLRPRDPITYEEAEFIMQKIKNDPSFKWDTVAQKLQAEKAVVSIGITDKKGLMSKAEAIFMLTHFK